SKIESYIKEGKLGFAFGKMSSTEFEINANKLQIAVLAFIVSFILVLALIAGIAEIIIKKQNKNSHSAPTPYEPNKNKLQTHYSKKVN
ncbi:hypothetical protein, partial [Pseudogracilibacillus sp. SO30301A]|uniref:hypothetical protein n=1 Tax=Pseudogracilibacillus sp. SO30301A TaxID=3098291 RepID=UPI00300E335A